MSNAQGTTNQSHEPERMAEQGATPRRKVEGVILTRSQCGWQTERLPIHGCRIIDNTGRLVAADIYDEELAEQIVAEHNQQLALGRQSKAAGDFASLWSTAPRSRTVRIEREDAEWWWSQNQGRAMGVIQDDLEEIHRMITERECGDGS